MVMDIGQNVLMSPVRERTVSHESFPVHVLIRAASDEVAVRTSPSQDEDFHPVSCAVPPLSGVLHDREPPSRNGAIAREEHVEVLSKPVKVLARVYELAARRAVLLHPPKEGRIFELTMDQKALLESGGAAEMIEHDGVLSAAPRVGRTSPSGYPFDVVDRPFGESVDLGPRHEVFDIR